MDVQSLELRIIQNVTCAEKLREMLSSMEAEHGRKAAAIKQRINEHLAIAADAKAAIRNRELAVRRMQKVRQL